MLLEIRALKTEVPGPGRGAALLKTGVPAFVLLNSMPGSQAFAWSREICARSLLVTSLRSAGAMAEESGVCSDESSAEEAVSPETVLEEDPRPCIIFVVVVVLVPMQVSALLSPTRLLLSSSRCLLLFGRFGVGDVVVLVVALAVVVPSLMLFRSLPAIVCL